jgi:5-oxoprolinase (ATP-hydrolysing) subunit C
VLKVLAPGLCSLLVDHGRRRSRGLGVPVGGPSDRWSLQLGNGLVGNPPDTTALEISLAGPTLEATCSLACVMYGAPFELQSNRQPLTSGKTFTLFPGEMLQIGGAQTGMRGYLCVRGGFQAPEILGSQSALRPLQAGDELRCCPGAIQPRFLRGEPRPAFSPDETPLHVLPGTQAGWFVEEEFYGPSFEISADSNRMGLRLRGKALKFAPREMVSEPVCPGTVQVTRDGQCILLGVDGQTIGGYPRIAHVISSDLDRLGQLRPGESVQFQPVSLAEAERLHHFRQAELRKWLNRLRHAEMLITAVGL